MTSHVTHPKLRVLMPVTIPTAALRLMSEADRERLIRDAFDTSPEALSNYLAVLDALIRVFEQRYELPSASLDEALGSGQLRDTADVSEWLFLAHLRSDLAGKARP